jgi:O-antigen/teichoic acid export membrane protein
LLGLTIATAYFLFDQRLSPSAAIAANLGATIVSVGVLVALVRRARPTEMATGSEEYDRTRWRRASYGLLAIGVAQIVLSQQSDLLIVGTMVSTQDSALYSAAAQFSILVGFAQTSLSFVAAPMIAELFERKDFRGLQRLVRIVVRGNALVTLPVMLVLLVFGRPLLGLYGEPFRAAYPVLVLLVIAASTVALVGSLAGFLLTMTEYQKEAAWIIGGSALLNLLLAVILTPLFGLVGTATATLIATVMRSAILVVFIRRTMGVAVLPLVRGA